MFVIELEYHFEPTDLKVNQLSVSIQSQAPGKSPGAETRNHKH